MPKNSAAVPISGPDNVLTTSQLVAVMERVGGIAVRPPLAAAVGLVDVLRCLLADEPAVALARLERLVASEAAGSAAAANPDRAVLRRRGHLSRDRRLEM